MTEWQTWDESFEVAERIDMCLCAYETLLTLTSPRAWGHDTDLGILAINLPLILSPTVWVACVSGPMKVTPSAACRDNKGFTFTAQAYQVEAEHAHSRVNMSVCVCERERQCMWAIEILLYMLIPAHFLQSSSLSCEQTWRYLLETERWVPWQTSRPV